MFFLRGNLEAHLCDSQTCIKSMIIFHGIELTLEAEDGVAMQAGDTCDIDNNYCVSKQECSLIRRN